MVIYRNPPKNNDIVLKYIWLFHSTDFFHLSDETATKLGFPAGVAKSVVQKTFERYERQTLYDEQLKSLNNVATSDSNVPAAVEEVEVQGEKKEPGITATAHLRKIDRSETYNGDDRGDYRWCQTLKDLDVRCNVVPTVCKAVQVKVNVESHHLKISANVEGDWCTLIDHSFPHKVNRNDCIWSLVPGDHIHVWIFKNIILILWMLICCKWIGQFGKKWGTLVGPSVHIRPSYQHANYRHNDIHMRTRSGGTNENRRIGPPANHERGSLNWADQCLAKPFRLIFVFVKTCKYTDPMTEGGFSGSY